VCCAFRIAACRQLLTSARCLLLLQVATFFLLPQKHTGESASCHVLFGLNDFLEGTAAAVPDAARVQPPASLQAIAPTTCDLLFVCTQAPEGNCHILAPSVLSELPQAACRTALLAVRMDKASSSGPGGSPPLPSGNSSKVPVVDAVANTAATDVEVTATQQVRVD
jgi:hypothetical protein